MKTFLTSLLVALTCCGNAQTFTDLQDSAYILLNKNRITTGALANRAFPWVDLTIPKTSEDTLNYSFLAQAWQQLYLSTYNRSDIRDIGTGTYAVT